MTARYVIRADNDYGDYVLYDSHGQNGMVHAKTLGELLERVLKVHAVATFELQDTVTLEYLVWVQ